MGLLSENTDAHSGSVYSVAFSPDGTKIVSSGWDRMGPRSSHRMGPRSADKPIKVWDADSFILLDSLPGEAMAFGKEAEGVVRDVRDGATVRVKDGGSAFYAPSPISSVAVSWPRIAAGAQSGELYHLEVM